MRVRHVVIPATATLVLGLYLGNQGHAAIQDITSKVESKVKSALGIHEILTQKINQSIGIVVESKDEIKFNENDRKVISEAIIGESYVYDTAEKNFITPFVKDTPFEPLGTESLKADCIFVVKVGYKDDDKYFKNIAVDDKKREIRLERPPLIISSVDPVSKDKLKSHWDLLPLNGYTDEDIANMFFYKSKELKENILPKLKYLDMFEELGDEHYIQEAKEKFSFMQGNYKDYEIVLSNKTTSKVAFKDLLDLRQSTDNK